MDVLRSKPPPHPVSIYSADIEVVSANKYQGVHLFTSLHLQEDATKVLSNYSSKCAALCCTLVYKYCHSKALHCEHQFVNMGFNPFIHYPLTGHRGAEAVPLYYRADIKRQTAIQFKN